MVNANNFNTIPVRPRVLIAPLDWGLGHATRCIPIIKELIHHNCDVIIAADEAPRFLLKKEFPGIVILRVNNYKIQYSSTGRALWFKLLLQFPKVVHSVWAENRWLKKIINQYQVDAVFADNRFGFYSTRIPSIYITHQLQIKTGNLISETIVRKIHYHFIKKFSFSPNLAFTAAEIQAFSSLLVLSTGMPGNVVPFISSGFSLMN